MHANTVVPQSTPNLLYIGDTKSGKTPAAMERTKVFAAIALALYRVKVSTR